MLRVAFSCGIALATATLVAVAPVFAADQTPHRVIFATDACDPATFNQAVGPGACVRNGGVTFQRFLAELERLQRAPQWRFTPDRVHARSDDSILVKNIGGETHTFTEVAQFGGGFVPQLNQLASNLTERPQCAAAPGPDTHILPAGASVVFTEEEPGTHLYQCCIHPWMHEVLTIREDRDAAADE